MNPEALQKLTESEVAQHTSLNPATAAAFENFFPANLLFCYPVGLSYFLFFLLLFNFPLFHRQARALCCAPLVSSRIDLASLFM